MCLIADDICQRLAQALCLKPIGAGEMAGIKAAGADRQAAQTAEFGQAHRSIGAGNDQPRGAGGKHSAGHCARREIRREIGREIGRDLARDLGRAYQQNTAIDQDLGCSQRVEIAAMVKRAHQPHDLVGGTAEVQPRHGLGPVKTAMQLPRHAFMVLGAAVAGAGLQRGDHGGKAVECRLETAAVQRQRRVMRADVKGAAFDNCTLVEAALDQMPVDFMLGIPLQKRPDRRIQPGMPGQGTVVEIDCALPRQCQCRLGQDRKIGDRQQPVDPRIQGRIHAFVGIVTRRGFGKPVAQPLCQILARGFNPQIPPARPSFGIAIQGDHSGDRMAALQPHVDLSARRPRRRRRVARKA
jgi:hypothetical protein